MPASGSGQATNAAGVGASNPNLTAPTKGFLGVGITNGAPIVDVNAGAPGATISGADVSFTPQATPGAAENLTPQGGAFTAPAAAAVQTLGTSPGAGASALGLTESHDAKNPAAAAAVLRSADKQLQSGVAAEARGMGELSVRKALDRIFDASHQPGVKTPTGPGSVAGRSQDLTEKLAKTVALANTSAPRDAPRLYNDVLETAAKELPAATAGQVKKTVLAFAAEKAALSLPELANSAYCASAAGQTQELKKDLAGLKGWEGLVPLANAPELRRVIADAKPQSEPHIWFRPSARGLEAVLPQGASAVKPLPKALASGFALQETAIAIPLEEQAQAAFLAAPTASNGAGWIFQTQRQAGAYLAGSVVAAASYWTPPPSAGSGSACAPSSYGFSATASAAT